MRLCTLHAMKLQAVTFLRKGFPKVFPVNIFCLFPGSSMQLTCPVQRNFVYFSQYPHNPIHHGPPRHVVSKLAASSYLVLDVCFEARKWIELNDNCKKFKEVLIAYFPLIRHGPHRKRRLQQFFIAVGKSLPSFYLATIGGYTDRPTDSLLIRHGRHRKCRVQQFFYGYVYSLPWERVYWAVA
jgi:hypothetical protein